MELFQIVVIALVSGAIAFSLGWFVGKGITQFRYKLKYIVCEKPGHVPDDQVRKKLMENIELALIRDGLIKTSEQDGRKTMMVQLYFIEDDE